MYDYTVSITAQETPSSRSIAFNATAVDIVHAYRIENKGPSPTNKDIGFRVRFIIEAHKKLRRQL